MISRGAGGNGANKWDEEWELGGLANATGQPFSASDRIRSKNYCACSPNTAYYFKAPSTYLSVFWYKSDNTYISYEGVSNSVKTSPNEAAYFKIVLQSATTYGNNIAVNYPSSVTTYSPYSNICPISGHTECVTERTGKNLLPNDIESYTLGSAYRYITRIMPDGVRAYMSFTDKDASVNVSDISVGFVHGYSGGSVRLYRWCLNDGSVSDHSNIASANTSVLCEGIIIYPRTEDAFNRLFARYDIMVELGTTATDYEPYEAETYTTTLGRTVYGGTLDVVSGELVVTRANIDDAGALNWTLSNGYAYTFLTNPKRSSTPITSGLPSAITSFKVNNGNDGLVASFPSGTYADATAFKTAMNGVQLCYELATPQTYQLDPTEVDLLLGQNNLWTDCGSVEVTYKADIQRWVLKKLSE